MTKTGQGKFVASVENKPLKEYTQKAQIEGTAPTDAAPARPVETASNTQPDSSSAKDGKSAGKDGKPASNPFVSPLDEMKSSLHSPRPTRSQRNLPKNRPRSPKNKGA